MTLKVISTRRGLCAGVEVHNSQTSEPRSRRKIGRTQAGRPAVMSARPRSTPTVSKASLRKRTTFSLMRLVILACVAGPQLALCQGQKRASQRVVADSCLPSSEFQLRGVSLGDDTTLALGTLGKALRTKTDSGVDDGGFFERRTIEYRDLSIVAVRGAIDQLTTRSARVTTPSGLRPGLSADEVRRILLSKG